MTIHPIPIPIAAALIALLLSAAAAAGPAPPGTVFRDCPQCPEMTVVPAGSFTMGSDSGGDHERPARRVSLARPFAIGRFEVTFDEWRACHEDGGCPRMPDDHGWGKGRQPIINVTFDEISGYIRWLSRKTGQAYRRPSEAEWEYAARGGTTSEYWWGDEIGENRANCRDCGSPWSGRGAAPVGSFAANPFGLYDTSGNVWEWVEDCWEPSHAGRPADAAPRLGGDCAKRVIRGGSWYYFSKLSRPSYRHKNNVRVKSYNIGFRVARDMP